MLTSTSRTSKAALRRIQSGSGEIMGTAIIKRATNNDSTARIKFIPNDGFCNLDRDEATRLPTGTALYTNRDPSHRVRTTQSGDLDSLHTSPLLTPAGESFLFRKMNYLKYLAATLCDDGANMDNSEVQQLLSDANAVHNHIAECNLRLIISIARKFATNHTEFDEYVSEGNMILLKAIDKFDFARGFRFSTYTTHSVQRHFYRVSQKSVRRQKMELGASTKIINGIPAVESVDEDSSAIDFEEQRLKCLLATMGECLDEREQTIVRRRFGVDGIVDSQTLREVAQEVGVCKERVRQIQIMAIEKMRDFFADLYPEFSPT